MERVIEVKEVPKVQIGLEMHRDFIVPGCVVCVLWGQRGA
jgi:hypothetical protein